MPQQAENSEAMRLDKWLWAARFFKTRSLARDAIAGGKVQYNGQRCKPSRVVEVGAQLKVPQGYDVLEIEVLAIKAQRQSAAIARQMYLESSESAALRVKNAEARRLHAFHSPRPEHRPDKKQRRQIIQFKQQ